MASWGNLAIEGATLWRQIQSRQCHRVSRPRPRRNDGTCVLTQQVKTGAQMEPARPKNYEMSRRVILRYFRGHAHDPRDIQPIDYAQECSKRCSRVHGRIRIVPLPRGRALACTPFLGAVEILKIGPSGCVEKCHVALSVIDTRQEGLDGCGVVGK